MTPFLVGLAIIWMIGVWQIYSIMDKIDRRGFAEFEIHAAILAWPITCLFLMANIRKSLTNNPET